MPIIILCSSQINPDESSLIKTEGNVERGLLFTSPSISECGRQFLLEGKGNNVKNQG